MSGETPRPSLRSRYRALRARQRERRAAKTRLGRFVDGTWGFLLGMASPFIWWVLVICDEIAEYRRDRSQRAAGGDGH